MIRMLRQIIFGSNFHRYNLYYRIPYSFRHYINSIGEVWRNCEREIRVVITTPNEIILVKILDFCGFVCLFPNHISKIDRDFHPGTFCIIG